MVTRLLAAGRGPATRPTPPTRSRSRCATGGGRRCAAAGRGRPRPRRIGSTPRSPRRVAKEKAHPMIGSVRGTVLERTRHGRGARRGRGRRLPRARARRRAARARTRRHARSCSRTCTCARTRWCSTASRRATSATRSRRSSARPASGPSSRWRCCRCTRPTALRRALLDDDLAALTLVPGVGKRTAQRLLVELKARLEVPDARPHRGGLARLPRAGRGAGRARRARVRARRGARRASASSPDDGTVEDLLREALKLLAVDA